jgi:hypothetical protein
MLKRDTFILGYYQGARSRGDKHEAAVRETVARLRKNHPEFPICEGAVKRALALWQPSKLARGIIVTNPNSILKLPDGTTVRVLLTASLGARPVYTRVNAVQPPL